MKGLFSKEWAALKVKHPENSHIGKLCSPVGQEAIGGPSYQSCELMDEGSHCQPRQSGEESGDLGALNILTSFSSHPTPSLLREEKGQSIPFTQPMEEVSLLGPRGYRQMESFYWANREVHTFPN